MKLKNKILAGLFGGLLLVAAAPASTQDPSLMAAIQWCDGSLRLVRNGRQSIVEERFAQMDVKTRDALAVVCRAYTSGYDQGRYDVMQNTT